jgi:hypothetical protein
MFNSAVLDILIGLMTIFLIVALAVTALSELVSQWLSMRASGLRRALSAMLGGGEDKSVPHWFLDLPIVKAMTGAQDSAPSYLDRQTFSAALLMAVDDGAISKTPAELDAAIAASKLPEQTRTLLRAFLKESADVQQLRANLESWFDRVMDRTSGWYKRRIANLVLVLSGFLVVGANIDTIAIGQALYGDPEFRAAMVKQALSTLQDGPPPADGVSDAKAPDQRLGQYQAALEELRAGGLPIGWHSMTLAAKSQELHWSWYLSKIAGWLITIFAASLGAPFWFDMLSKIANIRGTGPKPNKSNSS